jgi:LacI family transcriptional regulator
MSTLQPKPSPTARPTLQDVADAAGVAKSTASRALNGNGKKISQNTKRVVMEAADKLGYQPDLLVSQLAREHWLRREKFTGIPTAYIYCNRNHAPLGQEVQDTLLTAAFHKGFHINLFNLREYSHPSQLQRVMISRGIQAVMMGSCRCPAEDLDMDWSPFSCVACGNSEFIPPFDWVLQDYAQCTRMACEKIHQQGYQRPAITILHDCPTMDHWEIESAYLCAVQNVFHTRRISIYRGAFHQIDAFLRWLKQDKPDAVICNNSMPFWWMRAHVPNPPAFVSLSLDLRTSPCSGTLRSQSALVERACLHLESLIRHGIRGVPTSPFLIRLKPVWLDGTSLPPARLGGG